MPDLLEVMNRHPRAQAPVEEIHVLHQTDGVGSEAETLASIHFPAPHMIPRRVPQIARQGCGELAHHESHVVGHSAGPRLSSVKLSSRGNRGRMLWKTRMPPLSAAACG